MEEINRPQLRVAVCDDDARDRRELEEMAGQILREEGLPGSIQSFERGEALLSAVEQGAKFHILLLDVMMEETDGISLASALRQKGDRTSIVFISSNREMALRGYEVEAARYLAKPVDRRQLREALLFCCRRMDKKEILLPITGGHRRVLPSELIYAETWARGIRLVLRDGIIESTMKISELATLLSGRQFVFCHRTILVNLEYIQSIRHCELELKSGVTLPVSKYRQSELRKQLMRYLEG
ncbi:MAG: LytR/AlgR family response regulator transcription factor [Anaerovoracaceae bacterium]